MIILCGPSASGKTEVAKLLQTKYNIQKVVTNTTREIRCNEVNGIDYHFISKEEFIKLKNEDYFVETAEYNGNYYGCAKKEVNDNKVVVLEPNGVKNFLKLNDPHIIVFVLLADEKTRINRMKLRGDKEENIISRINNDRNSFSNDSLNFSHITINTDDKTLEEVTILVKYNYESLISESK